MMGNKWKILLLCGVILTALSGCGSSQTAELDFVREMGAGWNLGNSLESICIDGSYTGNALELYWQNPATTKEMIEEIHNAGFGTIRIPVTWENHMDSQGNMEAVWLDRVREVVDYAIEDGMYVILDAHHDTWFEPFPEKEETAVSMMEKVWNQIGEAFIGYDNHLLFEGMNEPRCIGTAEEWTGGSEETAELVNCLNQTFVDTIRAQGGNNRERYLLVTTYGGSSLENALKYFRMPEGEHLIVTVHAYLPYSFAMDEKGETVWQEAEVQEIEDTMSRLHTGFVSKGIPVIIGEFGAIDKCNTEERLKWLAAYLEAAEKNGISFIWWDEGGPSGETYGRFRIFDREQKSWLFPEIRDMLTE